MLPFLAPLYPRPYVPSTKIQSTAVILQCTCLDFISDVTFSGAPLPTIMRPNHKGAAAGWYPAHVSVFSLVVTFPGSSLPTPMRPKPDRFIRWLVSCSARVCFQLGCYLFGCTPMRLKHMDSSAGWYPAVHMSVFARMLSFWSSTTHGHCVPSTEIHLLAGILQYTFLFLSSGATFSGAPAFVLCVPLHQCVPPSGLVTV